MQDIWPINSPGNTVSSVSSRYYRISQHAFDHIFMHSTSIFIYVPEQTLRSSCYNVSLDTETHILIVKLE